MSEINIRSEEHTIDDAVDHLLILSDLHAHLPPLAAFERVREGLSGTCRILFNGDLFYGGPKPLETAQWVFENAGELATIGNHDEGMLLDGDGDCNAYTEAGAYMRLSDELREYFRRRPHRLVVKWHGKRIVLMHGHRTMTGEMRSFMSTPTEQFTGFADPTADLFATGHTHDPFVRDCGDGIFANSGSMSLQILGVRFANRMHVQSGEAEIKFDIRPSFLDVTEAEGNLKVEIVRFDYDREAALRNLTEAGHPDVPGIRRLFETGIIAAGEELG